MKILGKICLLCEHANAFVIDFQFFMCLFYINLFIVILINFFYSQVHERFRTL